MKRYIGGGMFAVGVVLTAVLQDSLSGLAFGYWMGLQLLAVYLAGHGCELCGLRAWLYKG